MWSKPGSSARDRAWGAALCRTGLWGAALCRTGFWGAVLCRTGFWGAVLCRTGFRGRDLEKRYSGLGARVSHFWLRSCSVRCCVSQLLPKWFRYCPISVQVMPDIGAGVAQSWCRCCPTLVPVDPVLVQVVPSLGTGGIFGGEPAPQIAILRTPVAPVPPSFSHLHQQPPPPAPATAPAIISGLSLLLLARRGSCSHYRNRSQLR